MTELQPGQIMLIDDVAAYLRQQQETQDRATAEAAAELDRQAMHAEDAEQGRGRRSRRW